MSGNTPVGSDSATTTAARVVRAWFDQNRDAWLDYVKALVLAESPSLEPHLQEQAMAILTEGFADAGFTVRRLTGTTSGGQLLAIPQIRKRGRPFQLLIGHCDTVWPVGTLREMPLSEDGNRLAGPGVFDMKAGLANIVFALRAVKELDLKPLVTPVVLVTSDEEVGSEDSQRIIERVARRADRAMVLEPALGIAGRIKTARKGTGSFRIKVEGKAAHAGLAPEEGASAILEMSHVIQELFALNDPANGVTVNVGTVGGGLRSNVVAPDSHAEVDVRVLTGDDAGRIDTAIRGLRPSTEGVRLTVSGRFERPPMEKTPRNEALWELCRHLGAEIGLQLTDGTAGGASDGNFTSRFCPTLDGLGAVGHGAHAQHEHILIGETLRRGELLTLMLLSPVVSS